MAARLILSRYGPKGNAKAIPAVDRHDGERQLDQFIVGELLSSLVINVVGDMLFGNRRLRKSARSRITCQAEETHEGVRNGSAVDRLMSGG